MWIIFSNYESENIADLICFLRLINYCVISRSSTSKIRVENGLITSPAPLAP
jgi:hypothetical protein